MRQNAEPIYFTTRDFAKAIGRTAARVRQLAREGRILPAFVTPSGQRIFTEEEAKRYQREVASRG